MQREKFSELTKMLNICREKMSPLKAYTGEAIASMCNKKLPAMQRFLRVFEATGIMIVNKNGNVKYYVLKENLKAFQVSSVQKGTGNTEKQTNEVNKN